MDGAGRRAERDRDREGAAGGDARQHETGGAERGGEAGTRGWIRERRTGGGEVSEKTEGNDLFWTVIEYGFTAFCAGSIAICIVIAFGGVR